MKRLFLRYSWMSLNGPFQAVRFMCCTGSGMHHCPFNFVFSSVVLSPRAFKYLLQAQTPRLVGSWKNETQQQPCSDCRFPSYISFDPPQQDQSVLIAPLFENINNNNKDDVTIESTSDRDSDSDSDSDSRDDHHDFFIDNSNITNNNNKNNNNKEDDVTIEWSTGGIVTPEELKDEEDAPLEPALADTDDATDTAGCGFLFFWFLFAIMLVSWCPVCVQFRFLKAAKKHQAPLDKLIRHILPRLQRKGRRGLGHGGDARCSYFGNYNVTKYNQFTVKDLVFILQEVFGKRVKGSDKFKDELINLVVTAYATALANMEMKELFIHVQGMNLPLLEQDMMDKDQLIRLAVEAGF